VGNYPFVATIGNIVPPLPVADGGTGGTTAAAAFANIAPIVAFGDTYLRSASIIGETTPRAGMLNTGLLLVTQTLYLAAVALPAGAVVGHLQFAGAAGMTTPSHWWFGLYDNLLNQLAVTADQTTTAWGATAYQSLAIATVASGAAASFTTTYTGLYYIGIMTEAATPPTLISGGNASSASIAQTPVLAGTSDTGQTTPPAFPHQATALTPISNVIYGAVAA